MGNDEYDPEFDSPEARANFATRHIRNLAELRRRRDELRRQFAAEKVVSLRPGLDARADLEAMSVALEWIASEAPTQIERASICQCETEQVIANCSNPERMRASLLALVFIDQFVFTRYRDVYDEFRAAFRIPKLRQHSFGGNASPGWLVCSGHGFDRAADWTQVTTLFAHCVCHLRRWLRKSLGRPLPELKGLIEHQIANEFEPAQQARFKVPIGA